METFVIRLWTPAHREASAGPAPLQGIVEHVRLGNRRRFDDGGQLVALLESAVADGDPAAAAERHEPTETVD